MENYKKNIFLPTIRPRKKSIAEKSSRLQGTIR